VPNIPHPKCKHIEIPVCHAPATAMMVVLGAREPKYRCAAHMDMLVDWANHTEQTYWVYDLVLSRGSKDVNYPPYFNGEPPFRDDPQS
jgi:hypothetical protein